MNHGPIWHPLYMMDNKRQLQELESTKQNNKNMNDEIQKVKQKIIAMSDEYNELQSRYNLGNSAPEQL